MKGMWRGASVIDNYSFLAMHPRWCDFNSGTFSVLLLLAVFAVFRRFVVYSGVGRVGVLGKHCQRHGGVHPAVRGLPKNPPPSPSQEREAGGTPVQEVGGGCAGGPLYRGRRGLHGK